MALDFSGDMCGKCRHINLGDRCTYLLSSTGFRCTMRNDYQGWDSKPCSKYDPDRSSAREKAIYNALP